VGLEGECITQRSLIVTLSEPGSEKGCVGIGRWDLGDGITSGKVGCLGEWLGGAKIWEYQIAAPI
jgi:hypothetical protein